MHGAPGPFRAGFPLEHNFSEIPTRVDWSHAEGAQPFATPLPTAGRGPHRNPRPGQGDFVKTLSAHGPQPSSLDSSDLRLPASATCSPPSSTRTPANPKRTSKDRPHPRAASERTLTTNEPHFLSFLFHPGPGGAVRVPLLPRTTATPLLPSGDTEPPSGALVGGSTPPYCRRSSAQQGTGARQPSDRATRATQPLCATSAR